MANNANDVNSINNGNNAENQAEGFDVYLETQHWTKVINVINERVRFIDRAEADGAMSQEMERERELLENALVEINAAAHETGIHNLAYNVDDDEDNSDRSSYSNRNNNNRNNNNRNNRPRNEASRVVNTSGQQSSANTRRGRNRRKNRKTRRA